MSAFDKLKLSKQLQIAVSKIGYLAPKELQQKLLPRIAGGQHVVAVAPEGTGKTTTYILAALNKLGFEEEVAPRILILVADIERGQEVLDQLDLLNRNRNLVFYGLFAGKESIQTQIDELSDGVDIIVATPDRAKATYLKLGLNLNKLHFFIVDDTDIMIKQGMQLPITELAISAKNSRYLIFSNVRHQKFDDFVNRFMHEPQFIEVDGLSNETLQTINQLMYQVPNFRTKLNLLRLLMTDADVFDKTIIFVNSVFTAQTVLKELEESHATQVLLHDPQGFSDKKSVVKEFQQNPALRMLILVNTDEEDFNVAAIPSIIHFDIPENTDFYLKYVLINEENPEQLSIIFSTDIELSIIRKIEQKQGKHIQVLDLPDNLYLEKDTVRKKAAKPEIDKSQGGAFHEKKPENSKTHNYSGREKVRLSGKISNKRRD